MKLHDAISEGISSKGPKRTLPFGTDLFRIFYRDVLTSMNKQAREMDLLQDRLDLINQKYDAGQSLGMSDEEVVEFMWDLFDAGEQIQNSVQQVLIKYRKGLQT